MDDMKCGKCGALNVPLRYSPLYNDKTEKSYEVWLCDRCRTKLIPPISLMFKNKGGLFPVVR